MEGDIIEIREGEPVARIGSLRCELCGVTSEELEAKGLEVNISHPYFRNNRVPVRALATAPLRRKCPMCRRDGLLVELVPAGVLTRAEVEEVRRYAGA